jgi:hypothetical protein
MPATPARRARPGDPVVIVTYTRTHQPLIGYIGHERAHVAEVTATDADGWVTEVRTASGARRAPTAFRGHESTQVVPRDQVDVPEILRTALGSYDNLDAARDMLRHYRHTPAR